MNLDQLDLPVLGATEPLRGDFWDVLGKAPHPVCALPTAAWLRTHSLAELATFLDDRADVIGRMEADPHRYGWEPASWAILDALCGFPWADPSNFMIAAETDPTKRAVLRDKQAWCLRVRRSLLKQEQRISVLLVNGGNRAGKSEWMASRAVKLLYARPGAKVWCFHQDEDMSKQFQQPLIHKYLPPEVKSDKGIRHATTYVSYKVQTGFTEGHFVLPQQEGARAPSECDFRYYSEDFSKIQGGEVDACFCDELVPATWIKELKARVVTRNGWVVVGFTPVNGYTPTVKMFLDVAQKTRESVAFALPDDAGPADLDRAMMGEDFAKWFEGDGQHAQPAIPAGRKFKKVKRVMRMPDGTGAVFYLHCFDNPFGNARGLYAMHQGDPTEYQKMKFYGEAEKSVQQMFGFDWSMHTFPPEMLPKRGTRYHIVDPCSGRNWFMIWILAERAPIGTRLWIYREWPCPGKYVPGLGNMGEWAVSGDKHDGEPGPAQQPLHWGQLSYKGEIFRLEGRSDWEQAAQEQPDQPFRWDEGDTPERKPPARGRRRRLERNPGGGEEIEERYMDSRYGASPTQLKEGDTTLLESCEEIGLYFVPASGAQTNSAKTHWIQLINNLLAWIKDDPKHPPGPMNCPRLMVSRDCLNTIFALQNWTGEDGPKGACMDPVAVVKYGALADLEDWSGDQP